MIFKMIFNDQLNKYNTMFLNQLKNLQFFIDFLQSNFFVQRKISSKTRHFQFFVLQLIFLRSFSFPNRSNRFKMYNRPVRKPVVSEFN